ncbi:phosphatidate cytidylyltransferase [Thermithiobacillus plumbiphilus]|uniref:Phosphatidate cytidylyltransferase n=1 Tax=Thermithiobacillus plumbiphilus TaxID=1729899 RepID=A0ABU9D3M9_9PROT
MKYRLFTALALTVGVLWILLGAPGWVFHLLLFTVLGLAMLEWALLSGIHDRLARLSLLASVLGISYVLLYVYPLPSWLWGGLALAWWGFVSFRVLRFHQEAPSTGRLPGTLLAALPTLLPFTALSLTLFNQGPGWVIWALLLVSAADVGAYFVGRALGKGKLAPQISPGKTWAGFWGGLLASGLVGTLGALVFFQPVWGSAVTGFLLGFITGFFGVIGDLHESMLKRRVGVKDSGDLLPGHGGILDRIDSLSAAVPIFVLGLMVMQ